MVSVSACTNLAAVISKEHSHSASQKPQSLRIWSINWSLLNRILQDNLGLLRSKFHYTAMHRIRSKLQQSKLGEYSKRTPGCAPRKQVDAWYVPQWSVWPLATLVMRYNPQQFYCGLLHCIITNQDKLLLYGTLYFVFFIWSRWTS